MLETVKKLAFRTLTSKRGNDYAAVRIAKDVGLFLNELAGGPLGPMSVDLEQPAAIRTPGGAAQGPVAPKAPAAPVMIYVDQKSRRDLDRIVGVLRGRDIKYQVLDVEEDRATKDWALRTAKVEDLPAVFIAGEAVGGFDALVQIDVSGELVRKVAALG